MSRNRNSEKSRNLKSELKSIEKQKNRSRNKAKKVINTRQEFVGVVSMTREGYAFIVVEGEDKDFFVRPSKLRGALNGDTVRIVVSGGRVSQGSEGRNRKQRRNEGEVIAVLERSKRPHVGILQKTRGEAWVLIESRVMPYDIQIPLEEADGIENGMKVAVIVTHWPKKSTTPSGIIVDVLGNPGENDTEMHAILAEFALPYKFEDNVIRAAEKISGDITDKEIASRRDMRRVTTFTIDPADAKDFDDALSLRKLDNGNWEVGVHIADVTHYVKPGTLLDKVALERATSVYLVDRTIPMLPEKLSNNLCSLRPNEMKLCFSAIFEMNDKAQILNRWFGRTVIESDYRFDYEQAQSVIESGEGKFRDEMLMLHGLASILRQKRFEAGAINFERPEMKIYVDEKGKPIRIEEKITKDSNWLIEEFMLLANRSVAQLIGAKKGNRKSAKTFVYRIHDQPNPEKLGGLRDFVGHFGYKFDAEKGGKSLHFALNDLLRQSQGKPEESAIEIMTLRSMAKAKYSTDNIGHYGLAFDYYTHFTSPIRRYPDMMVHRLLAIYLDNGKSQDKTIYESKCKYSSEREQVAVDAERASIKYKMVEFMQDKVGQVFSGKISGLTDWGMFVEIDQTKVEGMVSLSSINSDYYQFDEESFSLTGKSNGIRYMLGDKVTIKVIRANIEQKLLDFELVEETAIN